MSEEEIDPASPPEGEAGRKPLIERFKSREWEARAAVLAGVLGLAAAIIAVLKS